MIRYFAGPLAAFLCAVAYALPAQACDVPYRDVLVRDQARPDVSNVHPAGKLTSIIDVAVAADGTPTAFRRDQGSGNAAMDDAAMKAAKESSYLPKIADCKPVAGHYLFRLVFDPTP